MIYLFDCEVFRYDWIFCFKRLSDGTWYDFHNDPAGVSLFMETLEPLLGGFNNKHYDQFILKGILSGMEPEEVKALNDYIIGGGNGWEYPGLRDCRIRFDQFDLMDDMQMGLSLKAIEAHLDMNIQETEVDFDLDRPLTEEELAKTLRYCHADVDATEALHDLRIPYLNAKRELGKMCGLTEAQSLYMTNAKLTAAYLGAVAPATPRTDERNYVYPPNLRREYVDHQVFQFFDRMHDRSVPDEDLWSSKLDMEIGGCPVRVAYGGIHGALPNYREDAEGDRIIRNYDVASLYPSLMIRCGYTSRNIPDPGKFEETFHTRLAAKKSGDKVTANTLKLVLNTTYGAMLNQYNPLYDPLMGRSVCVSGQLFLSELAGQYVAAIPSLKLIQINTDGIMVSLEKSELPTLYSINAEWEKRTGFALEEDQISRIVQKDVNNYVMVTTDGKTKTKGGYLTYGIAPAGAFNVNNSLVCVKKALTDFFVKGKPVEESILENDRMEDFQIIAKAGSKYSAVYHIVNGRRDKVQRVNRVFATADPIHGNLVKVHAATGREAKIESLPEHCLIDNDHLLLLELVDKQFYIDLARKRVNDFLGIEEKKGRKQKMEATETVKTETPKTPRKKAPAATNLYRKLLEARIRFLQAGVKKTGVNRQLEFTYFDLEDIVPVALPIFAELGLLPVTNFGDDQATMTVIDVDDPEQQIDFYCDMPKLEPNKATNPVQAQGATQTYMRRYLYMQALDIVENDVMDKNAGKPAPAEKPHTPPPTPAQRQEVKEQVTAPAENADDIQLGQLKKSLALLREMDPSREEAIQQIAIATKGFTEISRKECETLLIQVGQMIAAAESKGAK